MNRNFKGFRACALLLLACGYASAGNANSSIAAMMKLKGEVLFQKPDAKKWEKAEKGGLFDSGSRVKTGADGMAMVKFLADKSLVQMRPKSLLIISADVPKNERKTISLEFGAVLFQVPKGNSVFEVKTPTSVATVKGTKFWVVVEKNGVTLVVTLEDRVELLNLKTGESITVGPGQTGVSDGRGVRLRDSLPGDFPDKGQNRNLQVKFRDSKGEMRELNVEFEKMN